MCIERLFLRRFFAFGGKWRVRTDILLEQGLEKKRTAGKEARDIQLGVLPIIGKTPEEPHNTQQAIADELGWSHSKVAMAELVDKHAPEEVKDKLRTGDMSTCSFYARLPLTFRV